MDLILHTVDHALFAESFSWCMLAEVMFWLSALWVKPWLSYSSASLFCLLFCNLGMACRSLLIPWQLQVEKVNVACCCCIFFLVCKVSYSLPHSAIFLRGARFQHSSPCNIPRHNGPSLHATKASSPCSEMNPQIFKPLVYTLHLFYLHLIDWISISIKKKKKILNGKIRAGWHLSKHFVMKLLELIKFPNVHVVIINFDLCKIPPQ